MNLYWPQLNLGRTWSNLGALSLLQCIYGVRLFDLPCTGQILWLTKPEQLLWLWKVR
jgi:hypothetical protein